MQVAADAPGDGGMAEASHKRTWGEIEDPSSSAGVALDSVEPDPKRLAAMPSAASAEPVPARATATHDKTEYLQHLHSALNLAGPAFEAYRQPGVVQATSEIQVFVFSDWPSAVVPSGWSKGATRPQTEPNAIGMDEWQGLADLAQDAVPPEAGAGLKDLKPLAYAEVVKTDTEFWFYANLEKSLETRVIIVTFRGTSDGADVMTDVKIRLDNGWKGTDANVRMHVGFKESYVSVQPLLWSLLDALMSHDKADTRPWQIYCTGHSLGGALASLAAFDLAVTPQWGAQAAPTVSLHTFGSPNVGNETFWEFLFGKLESSWHWANQGDPVTRVPSFGYWPGRTKVEISPDGVLTEDMQEQSNVVHSNAILDGVNDLITDENGEMATLAGTHKLSAAQTATAEVKSAEDYKAVMSALKEVNNSSEAKSRTLAPAARAVALGAPNLAVNGWIGDRLGDLGNRLKQLLFANHLEAAYFANFKAAVAALQLEPSGPAS